MIRPAVEAALAEARAGLSADPTVPPPPALKPYLDFARQSPMSLAAIARVVDSDAEFRARVADGVDEAEIGRAPWLWLARPEGWEDELAAIEAHVTARATEAIEQREERTAARKLTAARAALSRAESAAAGYAEQLQAVRGELARERAARSAAEARIAELESTVHDLGRDRAAVVRNLKHTEALLVERGTALNEMRARVRALEAELRSARAAASNRGRTRTSDGADVAPSGTAVGDRAHRARDGSTEPHADERTSMPDPAEVAREVTRAAEGATAIADALNALARLVTGERSAPVAPVPGASRSEPGASAGEPAGAPAGAPAGEQERARRTPLTLPGGVFDDSVEAAEHLLGITGGRLVIDGYNVTMEGWPDLGASEQRMRLLTALSDLAHRFSTVVDVVFDGAAVEPLPLPAPARRLVRVRFSPAGIEADDVVIDLVNRIPAATPVIVVSSDRRVRDGARRAGANLLHARQLLALLRR